MGEEHVSERDILKKVAARLKRSESFVTAAVAGVQKDLDEMRSRVDATHSIVNGWHTVEDTLKAKNSAMRLDISDMQKAIGSLQHEIGEMKPAIEELWTREDDIDARIANTIEHDLSAATWALQQGHGDLSASMANIDAKFATLLSDVQSGHEKAEESTAQLQRNIASLEEYIERSKSNIIPSQAQHALSGKVDYLIEDVTATQESLEAVENSVSGCLEEVAGLRGDMERRVAAVEVRLRTGSKKIMEALLDIGAVEQEPAFHSPESSRCESEQLDEAQEHTAPNPSQGVQDSQSDQENRPLVHDNKKAIGHIISECSPALNVTWSKTQKSDDQNRAPLRELGGTSSDAK